MFAPFSSTVCNFQSIKSPVELNSFFSKLFCYLFETVAEWFKNYKLIKKSIDSSKNRTRDFQNSLLFERSACFHVTISENFERFQYFHFEIDFLEKENLFQNSGVPFFR